MAARTKWIARAFGSTRPGAIVALCALLMPAVVAAVPVGALAEQGSQPASLAAGRLDAGGHFSCALLDDSSVRCWGFSGSGQLGYGNTNTIGDDETPGSVGPVNLANQLFDVQYANSTDDGLTFGPNTRMSDRSFPGTHLFAIRPPGSPPNSFQTRDYDTVTGLASTDIAVIGAWGDTRNDPTNSNDLWSGRISFVAPQPPPPSGGPPPPGPGPGPGPGITPTPTLPSLAQIAKALRLDVSDLVKALKKLGLDGILKQGGFTEKGFKVDHAEALEGRAVGHSRSLRSMCGVPTRSSRATGRCIGSATRESLLRGSTVRHSGSYMCVGFLRHAPPRPHLPRCARPGR